MSNLKNKTIIITGGSLGIGFAIAKKCVQDGARVIIASRNKTDLENALTELNSIGKEKNLSYSLDIGDLNAVRNFAKWCNDEKLEISGLVNNAGIYGPMGKTTLVDMDEFTNAIQINFLGTVYMCNVFAPLLKSTGRKKIVNYSGGGAATPFANYSAYATSKIAIVRFTENLAIELADENFDINCVAPGFVVTRLHNQTLNQNPDSVGKNFFENTKKQVDSGGVPPEKAADLTAFLLSDDSDGITGKFISAPWDDWQSEEFKKTLLEDKDFATLRRIDNKNFYKKI
ncbi:MAG TPA: SDR family oxidoreductase [Ignavibacteria bacterium]|nr:SDR family oxidoreductase [Ignavibacteria bacterium]